MSDYQRGVEQASAVYQEVIREYVTENDKLRELVRDMFSYAFNREMELCDACVEANGEYADCAACDEYDGACGIAKKRFEELYAERMRELGMVSETCTQPAEDGQICPVSRVRW